MRIRLLWASTSLALITSASLLQAQSSTETYTYDALGRLVKVVTQGGQSDSETQSICYDEADNRTQYVANESAGATECTGGTSAPPPPPPANNPPQAVADLASSSSCTGTLQVNLTANDSDPEGHTPLQLTAIARTSGGATATIVSNTTVQVVLSGAFFDISDFNYTVADSLGATSTGTLTVSAGSCGGFPGF